jgi:catechol 2,3-dioxygenase-like lactoylglutathione lyase family enzyme
MPLHALDHYTIITTDVEETARFYETVFELERGPAPDLGNPIVWLYGGGNPLLHIVTRKEVPGPGSGRIDHVAFRATDYAGTLERLAAHEIRYQEQRLPEIGTHQLFAECADGTWVELVFDPKEVDAAKGA